jgi:tetratricopeptide (TPR) repeat protein
MEKRLVLCTLVVAIALASAMTVKPAGAVIQGRTWLGSMYSWGTDPYYGVAVYGYRQGSTALVSVEIRNHLSTLMNVSEVIVSFDWNANYTNFMSTPLRLQSGEVRSVPITFTVPNATIASNMYPHGYTIYVKHINATGALVDTMTLAFTSDPRFAVYSDDQYTARQMSRILSGMAMPVFNSTAAKLSWSKATNETSIAAILYEQGDFSGAIDHYTRALNYRNQAFSTETAITGGVQDAELALINAQAKSFEAQANYLNGLSNMWILIGVAAVLFAIGYIIRGLGVLRKPVATT